MKKKNISKIHKNIYEHIKKRALSYEGKKSKELKQYLAEYEKIGSRKFYESSEKEILSVIRKSHITYLGDFHTFDQNQKTLIRIMRALCQRKKKFTLFLELIHTQKQHIVDAFLNNEITELEFLEGIDYHEAWRFPWSHYKIIFDFVKSQKIEVVAINSSGSLAQRDNHACEIISHYHQAQPKQPLLILIGELHIIPDKLPAKIKLSVKDSIKQTILYQNIDKVYFKQQELNHYSKIVKFNDSEFCIQTSPPWVKYESMVYWYENLLEDPEFDIHSYIIENGLKTFGSNTHENFLHISKEIIRFLNLKIPHEYLDNFELLDHSKIEYVENEILDIQEKNARLFYLKLLAKNHSFKFYKQAKYYCSNYSINKITYLAGKHLFHYFKDKAQTNLHFKNKDQFLIHFTLEHLYAYFFSKIFNPHRKCDLYQDLLERSENSAIKNAIDFIDTPDKTLMKITKQNYYFLYEVSKIVGQFYGDYLFNFYMNKKSKAKLNKIIFNTNLTIDNLIQLKNIILQHIKYKQMKKRVF